MELGAEAPAKTPRLRPGIAPGHLLGVRRQGDDVGVPLHPWSLGNRLGKVADHSVPADLRFSCPLHRPAKGMGHDLIPVADPEDGTSTLMSVADQHRLGYNGLGDVRPVDAPLAAKCQYE